MMDINLVRREQINLVNAMDSLILQEYLADGVLTALGPSFVILGLCMLIPDLMMYHWVDWAMMAIMAQSVL
jgi:hypothetical protein